MSTVLAALANTLALAGVLAVNGLANILPINGLNTGQVSASYPSLFTPAGITFSIWSIIYLLLIGFVVLQWFRLNDVLISTVYRRITPLFIISSIFNMAWIIVWHYLYVWTSVLIMILLLITLTILFMRLQQEKFSSTAERVFISLPFTIYFAWICVATIANISAALISLKSSSYVFSSETWTIIVMIVALLLAFYITLRFKKPAFAAVVTWALAGIYMRSFAEDNELITSVALLLAVLCGLLFFYSGIRNLRTFTSTR